MSFFGGLGQGLSAFADAELRMRQQQVLEKHRQQALTVEGIKSILARDDVSEDTHAAALQSWATLVPSLKPVADMVAKRNEQQTPTGQQTPDLQSLLGSLQNKVSNQADAQGSSTPMATMGGGQGGVVQTPGLSPTPPPPMQMRDVTQRYGDMTPAQIHLQQTMQQQEQLIRARAKPIQAMGTDGKLHLYNGLTGEPIGEGIDATPIPMAIAEKKITAVKENIGTRFQNSLTLLGKKDELIAGRPVTQGAFSYLWSKGINPADATEDQRQEALSNAGTHIQTINTAKETNDQLRAQNAQASLGLKNRALSEPSPAQLRLFGITQNAKTDFQKIESSMVKAKSDYDAASSQAAMLTNQYNAVRTDTSPGGQARAEQLYRAAAEAQKKADDAGSLEKAYKGMIGSRAAQLETQGLGSVNWDEQGYPTVTWPSVPSQQAPTRTLTPPPGRGGGGKYVPPKVSGSQLQELMKP